MSRCFIAWLTLALLLLALGHLNHGGGEPAIAGFVSAPEQEAGNGYVSVGSDAMVVGQGTGLQHVARRQARARDVRGGGR